MAYLSSDVLIPKFEKWFIGGLVLDIGCGKGGLAAIVKTVPERKFDAEFVGIDACLDLLMKAKPFMEHLVLASADHLPFREHVFDAVFSLEVIEHLPKPTGDLLLNEAERLSKGLVAFTTPCHFFSLESNSEGTTGEFMIHRSLWSSTDFKERGFSVEGLHAARNYLPAWLSKRVVYFACSLLAYKITQSYKKDEGGSSSYG